MVLNQHKKSGAIIMMNTWDYIKEAYRQMNDRRYYSKLEFDPIQYAKKLKKSIRLYYLIQKRIYYMLPKVHKPEEPGRLISRCMDTYADETS